MAFKRWKKAPTKRPPSKLWPDNEMKVIGWCLQNNIEVGISPDWRDDYNRWEIDITINGRVHTDPNKYKEDGLSEALTTKISIVDNISSKFSQ